MMTAVAVLALEVFACFGFGATVLRVLGLLGNLKAPERLTWSFAIGYGVLGWLLFFVGVAGMFSPIPLALLLAVGTMGLVALRGVTTAAEGPSYRLPWTPFDKILLAALAVALIFDLLEGMAPPADADSLAYHFALPKQFLAAGRLEFVPRAVDGAIPLLNQMTYIPALGLGGEKALTLWTMVSGWGATALLYTMCLRHLNRRWSLACAVIFLTTPAIVFGGGSGQVEVRNAMFAIVAAIATAEAVRTGDRRYALLAGLGVGFFMAAKYIGLLFAAACGLAILRQARWPSHGTVLMVTAMLAGGQWYIWNWLHTGDPVFPMLFGSLDYSAAAYWNEAQNAAFRFQMGAEEQAVPSNILWLVSYPFVATLKGYRAFESTRIGFGPFVLLALPFAAAGLWHFRDRLKGNLLVTIGVITAVFYVSWFFAGSSQRVRHLIPVLPLLLVCIFTAAARWVEIHGNAKPLATAILLTLGLQLAGHGLFTLGAATYFVGNESRDAYLQRYAHSYGAAIWVNKHLPKQSLLYTQMRQLVYLFDVPVFYSHHADEGQIDNTPEANDPDRFLAQMKVLNITHLLVYSTPGNKLWEPLQDRGCLKILKKLPVTAIGSRTLRSTSTINVIILKLQKNNCP